MTYFLSQGRLHPTPPFDFYTVNHLTKLLGDEDRAGCLNYIARSFDKVEEEFLRNAP